MRSLGKKPHFGAFPEAKKGVVKCARLRKAAQGCASLRKAAQGCARLPTGPIIIQIPRSYQKKSFLCRKSAILSIRWEFQF